MVSFLSPCTLPLLPGYLSYISGLGAEEVQAGRHPRLVLGAAVLFVLGFSLVFVALGATMSYIGSIIAPNRDILTRAAGVFIIIMALAMLGVFRRPIFYRERRLHVSPEWGVWSAFPLGMAFGFGWSPCIGPVLTSILGLAATEGSVQRGAFLLFVYSLGLGVPFLAVAAFAGTLLHSLGWFKRHYRVLNVVGSGILLLMGTFLVMNRWTEVLAPVMSWYNQLNLPT